VSHIICAKCSKWQGNLRPDGPIGWFILRDGSWYWDHDCRNGRERITILVDELGALAEPARRIRRYPTPIG
jgi:hypothetical protein